MSKIIYLTPQTPPLRCLLRCQDLEAESRETLLKEHALKDKKIAALEITISLQSEMIEKFKLVIAGKDQEIEIWKSENEKLAELFRKCEQLKTRSWKWFSVSIGALVDTKGKVGLGVCVGLKVMEF